MNAANACKKKNDRKKEYEEDEDEFARHAN